MTKAHAGAVTASDGDATVNHFRWRRRVWAAVAALLVAGGSAGAVVAASIESRHNAARARQAVVSSAAAVAWNLQLAIQHEQDLVVSAGGFVAGNPHATNTQFVRWAGLVRALQRYPEVLQLARAEIVPVSKLTAYGAAAVRDPAGQLAPGRVFSVSPAGHRSFYCFIAGYASPGGPSSVPAGSDVCDSPLRQPLLTARDSGASAYIPTKVGPASVLLVFTPVYRAGLAPSSIAARRAAFLGWVGMSVVPAVLLERALAGYPGTAVTFRYGAGSSTVVLRSGTVSSTDQSATVDLHNGWTVRTFAAARASGLFAGGRPGMLLVGGIALSVLMGLVVFLFGRGRARATRLVELKTDQLVHQALHDGLTGLPNRALVADRVEQLLARSRRNGTTGAVLFVDLDGFKIVNDTLGHQAGDELLAAVAERLASGLREVDTVGRLGGDEFVVLIDGGSHVGPELVAARLLELMRQPFELECSPTPITVTTSVGIAVGVRATAGELLRDADMALYQAKAAGRDCSAVFHPEMESALRRDLEIDLRSALANDEFRLVYQPIYDLDDLALVGVEALLRWDHPVFGVIAPDDFIPLLESSGRIREVGRWVLGMACQQMAAWHALGSTVGISVNVSERQLDDDAIVTDVRAALAISRLDPAALTLEITETALMRNVDASARRLAEIRALEVNLAIDDFGTGYSSPASLKQLPIDAIKIDREFSDALTRSPQADALIRTLVQLGRDLGLKTVAEGVETLDQLDHLRGEHVDDVQGFLLSKPLEADAVEALILPALAPEEPRTT